MLAGVGGRTVAEAKECLQYAEFLDWLTFRHMRGSLFVGNRLESGFALLAALVTQAAGGKATQRDFMPHADVPDASIADVMNILSGRRK